MQTESECIDGTGSQLGGGRWGDYSTVSIDPSDDCTFWVTNEYVETTGSFQWDTQICSFSFASCSTGPCGDGFCDGPGGEDCTTCSQDCPSSPPVLPGCGNGFCEPGQGEDCLNCAADCNGKQNGKQSNRFCCGDGDGQNPVDCSDSRCNSQGFQCSDILPGTRT